MGRRDRLALVLCSVAIGIAVLAVGGATRWAQALIALAVSALVMSTLLSKRGFERRPPLLITLGVACAWTFVQWIPLPSPLVQSVSPTLEALRVDGVAIAGVDGFSRLSMDPSSTLRALTFLLTLSGVAFVALRVAIYERGRYGLMASVAGFAGLAALVTGIHELFDLRSLYGLYEPRHGQPLLMAPLFNTNHFGCLMAVGTVTSLGLFLYPKQSSLQRSMWVLVGVSCLVSVAATLSRGAMIGLAAGFIAMLFTLLAQRMQAIRGSSRRRREKFFATTVPVGIMIACGLIVAVYVGATGVMTQLENTTLDEVHAPTSKFAAWKSSIHLLEESPWVGVGRGAFESTFTRVHPASAFATFSNPENEGLQAILEWGIPASVVIGAMAVWMLFLALRRWKDGPLAASAMGAVIIVLFQSNFDFGMELLGLAIPVTVLLATLAYVPLAEMSPRLSTRVQAQRIAHAAVIFAGAIALFTGLTRVVDEDHVTLRGSSSRAEILDAIEHHPLDYFGYALLTQQQLAAKEPGAIRTLNHSLRLHPTHPGLHRIAAQLLVRSGLTNQAESEYATAIRYSPDPRSALTELIATLDPARAARSIPVDVRVETTLRALTELQRPDIAALWLERVLIYTRDIRAAESLHALSMTAKNYDLAEKASRARCEIIPSKRCQLELARVLGLAKKHAEVVITLEDVVTWRGRVDDQFSGWLMLCDARIALVQVSEAKECLRRLDVSGLVKTGEPEIQRRKDVVKQLEIDAAGIKPPPLPPGMMPAILR
ncbi:MAG: O-antigen polymerase [Myxococcales bacterium]|nr:O-antigen polymerase [Myxococcales bacterium]